MTTQENEKSKMTKEKIYEIIFEADTPSGKSFDILLLWAIIISTLAVMLESVKEIGQDYSTLLTIIEWVFTILFTVEYVLRLYSARSKKGYALSFYGIIDLLSILPTYLTLLSVSSQFLIVIRIFRLMRVFRVLKLSRLMSESDMLWQSLKASRAKIAVFLFAVFNVAVIMGTIMYIVEGGENGFNSIPQSIYWAVVTMTTVGYGDIHAITPLGQFFSVVLMILGYGIIAVPTGIVGVEMIKDAPTSTVPLRIGGGCENCEQPTHLLDAKFCHNCGSKLD